MQNSSKILVGVGVLIAVALAGLGIGWLATRGSPPSPNPPQHVESVPNPAVPPRRTVEPSTGPGPDGLPATPGSNDIAISPRPLPAGIITNWDDRLEEIIIGETDDTNKLKQLFEMFPHLPEEGQVEVAKHLSNLVEDENYTPLGQLLQNARLPEEALEVLMSDLLNRPNDVKLPMFLDLARNKNHPKADEAKELLELYLDEDYGTDWAKWETKMKEWLKENPD